MYSVYVGGEYVGVCELSASSYGMLTADMVHVAQSIGILSDDVEVGEYVGDGDGVCIDDSNEYELYSDDDGFLGDCVCSFRKREFFKK